MDNGTDADIQEIWSEIRFIKMQLGINEDGAQMLGFNRGAMPVLQEGGGGGNEGCFEIYEIVQGMHGFKDCYYQIGGEIHEHSGAETVEEFVCQGTLQESQEYTASDKPYVYLRVVMDGTNPPESEILAKKTMGEVKTEADDENYYVKPLYKLSHDGSIVTDFRTMPQLAAWEVKNL